MWKLPLAQREVMIQLNMSLVILGSDVCALSMRYGSNLFECYCENGGGGTINSDLRKMHL